MIDITLLKRVLRHACKKLTNDSFSHATEFSFSKLDAETFYFILIFACLLLNSNDFLQLGASIFFISTFTVFVWIFRECLCMNKSFNGTNCHIQKPKALTVGFNFILCEKNLRFLRFKLIILYHLTDHHIKKLSKKTRLYIYQG